jgi:hypothetical protein
MYRRMWIFVEGRDDRRFVDAVLRPILEKEYDFFDTWEYAQETPKKVVEFLRAMKAMRADCLLLADIDDSPCVSAKKEVLGKRFQQALEPADAVVVVREIESWYIAGLDDETCQELGIASLSCTDQVTKEQFRTLVPKRFDGSVADFMIEMLRPYRTQEARARNRSFGYLMDLLETRLNEA